MPDLTTPRRVVARALLAGLLASIPTAAAMAAVANTPLCVAAYNQMPPSGVSNGAGGTLITWADIRSGDLDIYMQETNSVGEPEWTVDGIPICKVAGYQQFPKIISDGVGGAIVVWQDLRGTTQDIYAQRVSSSGSLVWATGGVPVCTAAGVQEYPQLVADGTGGAVIAWVDRRGAEADIYVQRIDASGNALWTPDGLALCTATGPQTDLTLSSDNWGGAIALWKDARSGATGTDVFAQRVTSSGVVQWVANGMPVCNALDDQQTPVGIPDGVGGLVATWSDHRNGNWDVFAQRLNDTGAPTWAVDGVGLCSTTGDQTSPKLCSDGASGAIVAWEDRRGANADIYAQRVNAGGTPVWVANGATVCTATTDQTTPTIFTDYSGGAVIAWSDGRTPANGMDIYTQRVNAATGAPAWPVNGVVLCDTTGNQEFPVVVGDGQGGAIAAWRDYRPGGGNTALYGQHIDAGGLVLGQCPAAANTLTVNATATVASPLNYYDVPVPITFYWSGIGVRPATGTNGDWDIEFYNTLSYPQAPYPVCFANGMAGSNGNGTVDLVVTSYETARTPSNTTYGARVSRYSGTGNGSVEWDLTGQTIVKDLAGVNSAAGWTGILDTYDVRLVQGQQYTFTLTRTGTADIKLLLFTSNGVTGPYSAGRSGAVFETQNHYTVYTAPATEYYGVVLVNDNGQSGTYNVKVNTGIPTGVGDTQVAESMWMGVAPNPAHGKASFRFALKQGGEVGFRVLDMAGRVVRSIPSQRWQAGTWTYAWDGRGSDGQSLSAGVYFVQMELDGRKLGQQRLAVVR